MSQSNNVMEEGNVIQHLHGSGSSLLIQSQPPSPKTKQPSIDTFVAQCDYCFKWRVMPSMEKYQEVREQLMDKPFFCQTACEWEPGMSCDVPENLSRYATSLWAIDRAGISRPPIGWKRLLQIRSEGCSRFADVYYVDPSGKKLRSIVDVEKYLNDLPQEIRECVNLSQFSFQTPIPTEENYVRKRPTRPSKRIKSTELTTPGPSEDLARQE